ncbi:peptidase C39 [Lachnoclostridium sp. Marseille-P6806]|uniref:peptidase C39 n=1 Tax=Lachnoclostridium sp. Marseille-P6806 TaxID=2364793 RepID=UPI00103055F1|nr:peptidase C39 [Lachnoclostridium sp. Marseille-P6806]
MKTPLRYQSTEYDCGPTSIINAIQTLFQRSEIPPEFTRTCAQLGNDLYNTNCQPYRCGTSCAAMQYCACWFNNYAAATKYPILVRHLSGRAVHLQEGSELVRCLSEGGAAVVRVELGCAHFITLTGVDRKRRQVYAFDAYYREAPFAEKGIAIVTDRPKKYNRILSYDVLDRRTKGPYSLYHEDFRDATLFYRTAGEIPKYRAFH